MNTHLSEILSWVLEPVANAMMSRSSEVISNEHLKSKLDQLNSANKNWKPEKSAEGSPADQGEMEEAAGVIQGRSDCDGCDQVLNSEEDGHREGAPAKECSSDGSRSMRNRAVLMKEKREQLKEKRLKVRARKPDDRLWISSKEVANRLIQDRSRPMVIVGSDCVSLYPNLMKVESADEVAQAVIESEVKWEGINWKEAVRYIALCHDELWCRSSRLARVLPRRRHKKGTRPGVTGAGPRGPEEDGEEQWKFPPVELAELEKRHIMAEVMRIGVETMFQTHAYSFGGATYIQSEGGPIGLRSTCAVARVVMARWDEKWKERLTEFNIVVEEDGS